MPAYQPLETRFWAKVAKGTASACWVWTGAMQRHGYGIIKEERGVRRSALAHRVAWRLAHPHDDIDGLNICHRCDNPRCVNVEHLFVGTQLENMRDCRQKGRIVSKGRSGEAHPLSKLTRADVANIRRVHAMGQTTQDELAETYGVRQSTISKIIRGQRWKAEHGIEVQCV